MLKFVGAVTQSNFRRLSSPFKLSYAVTYRCNLKCKMCNIWNKEHVQNELTPDDIGRFFSKPHKIYWLGITGGEPFLRSDLPEIVDAALAPSPSLSALHFATNGTLTPKIEHLVRATKKKYKKLKMVFTLSVDGPPELHNRIRGAQDVWASMFKTFALLKKIDGVKPQFGFTLSHENIDKFEDTFLAMRAMYPQLRFDDVTVNIFQRSSFYYDNHGMAPLNADEVSFQIKKILKMDKDKLSLNNFLRRRYLQLYLKFLKTKKSPVKCQSLASTCFLDPYGNLYPCAVYNKKLLNIKDTTLSLKEAWRLKEAKKIHQECATNKCPSCWSPCDAYSAIGGSIVQSMVA
jgi:MoaA/NifB/PqqE/SkfB family radical SAM enzyme